MVVTSESHQQGLGRREIDPLASAQLQITVDETVSGPVITLAGELDIASAPFAEAACFDVFHTHQCSTVVVDTARLSFCDCAGLNMLLHVHERALVGSGWVRISGAGPRLRKVLGITGLASTLLCYPIPSDAFADAEPGGTPAARVSDERA